MNELCHEFEDRRGASWVVVPQLDGPLQNGHICWISTEIVKEHFSPFCDNRSSDRAAPLLSAVRIHPVEQHHEARLGVEGERDAPQVSD